MSGRVVVDGNVSQSAGATGRGGLLVVRGNASSRCGISMKGIDIVVGGSVGHMSAFMAQTGCLVVCGDAGEALGDSIYEARLYVRGSVASLGADCVEKEMRDEHVAQVRGLLERGGDRRRAGRVPPLRLGAPALHLPRRQRGRVLMSVDDRAASLEPARVVPLRPHRHRRDPARGDRGHLRHPRASARSGACRTSTTSSSSARRSRATRSRATASGARPTSSSARASRRSRSS